MCCVFGHSSKRLCCADEENGEPKPERGGEGAEDVVCLPCQRERGRTTQLHSP